MIAKEGLSGQEAKKRTEVERRRKNEIDRKTGKKVEKRRGVISKKEDWMR